MSEEKHGGRPLFPGETDGLHRLKPQARLRLEMNREVRWYERTGRRDHEAGECTHYVVRNGQVVLATKLERKRHEEPIESEEHKSYGLYEDLEATERQAQDMDLDALPDY